MPHPGGRPRQLTPEKLLQVSALRAARISWREIGLRLALRPETCRRAYWELRKAQTSVGNSSEPLPHAPSGG